MTSPGLVLLFNYRTLLDPADIDSINFVAWQEVLDAFGYVNLTFDSFILELTLQSADEIMTSLCPFTTKAEWEPLLNKRDIRLQREVSNLCAVEVRPTSGLKDFIIDCAKHTPTTVIFLSPMKYDVTRTLLEKAECSLFVDAVHSYAVREFAILDALELVRVRPPVIPSNLRSIWDKPQGEEASASSPSEPSPLVIAFEADVIGVRFAKKFGIVVIGLCNPSEEEEEDERQQSVSLEAGLLAAGASTVIANFLSLKFEYLHHLK